MVTDSGYWTAFYTAVAAFATCGLLLGALIGWLLRRFDALSAKAAQNRSDIVQLWRAVFNEHKD